jgi:hypothetical protein
MGHWRETHSIGFRNQFEDNVDQSNRSKLFDVDSTRDFGDHFGDQGKNSKRYSVI